MHPGYFPVLLWSLTILVSFWGYGEALRRWTNRKEFDDLGWGLTCAWGMSVVLAIGGGLMALRQAKAPNLTLAVLFGAALAVFYLAEKFTAKASKRTKGVSAPSPSAFSFQLSGLTVPVLVLCALAGLAFASSIAWPHQIDPNDDVVCYLFFPEKILQTGTLIEPFNVRRMGTYGGQALLQALVMIVGGERNGHVPDRGFGMLMLFGMLLHLSKATPPKLAVLRFLALAALFFVAVPRINTGSALTGSVLILALLETLRRLSNPPASATDWQRWIPCMILVAAAGSLRPTYLLCTAGIVAALPMVKWLLERPSEGRSPLRLFLPVAWVAAGSFVLLVPWASVLWQSNQTPLYPPFLGTMNPEFTVLGNKAGAFHDISHAFAYLFIPEVVVLLLCFLLAACVPNRPLVLAAAAVAVGVSIFTSYKFGVTVLFESYRYTFPMLMPVALWTVLSAISSQALLEFKTSASGMAAVIGLLLAVNLTGGSRELQAAVDGLPAQISSRQPLINPALTNAVQELQRYTPEGSAIFAAVDTPYAFNFARNRIVTADVPGGARIGTWPVGQGPEALKAYLLSQGIDYLMVPDFDNAMLLYTRKHWTEHQRPEWFFKEVWGKYSLDFMESADQLARSQGIVATAANLRLIDLN